MDIEPTRDVGRSTGDGLSWAFLGPSQGPPLLAGKLRVPRHRPDSIARPALVARLEAGTHRPLTVISAPAGYGKTTLLSEWAVACTRPLAWISLEANDSELTRFLAYLMAALGRLYPQIGEVTCGESPPTAAGHGPACLTAVLNEIDAQNRDGVLVLDDWQVIGSSEVEEVLLNLVEHLPRGLHLVLASRTDPALPLARLRARGWACELGPTDLAFTTEETEQFLARPGVPRLNEAELAVLHARTEGWAVGLQLAALALEGRRDAITLEAPLRASSHLIAEFLADEVLRGQPTSVREFLLKTSVLERFSAPLCDAVLGNEANSSAGLLETLEHRNLFLVPLDDEREWFRYHSIFAELLRGQLERAEPEAVPSLLSRASLWYEERGRYDDAIAYAEAASDVERVADLLVSSRHWFVEHGKLSALLELVEKLPDHSVQSHPELALSHAWGLVPAGRTAEAEEALDETTSFSEAAPDIALEEREALLGEVSAVRAMMDALSNDRADIRRHSEEALERLPAERCFLRALMQVCLGWALKVEARSEEARVTLNKALITGRRSQNVLLGALAKHYLACLASREGKLHEAAATLRDVLESTRDSHDQEQPLRGPMHVSLGAILYEWNELDEAERHLRLGLELGERWRSFDALWEGCFRMGWLLLTTGRTDEAIRFLDRVIVLEGNLQPVPIDMGPHGSVSPFTTHLPIAYTSLWYSRSAGGVRDLGYEWADEALAEAEGEHRPNGALLLKMQHAVTIRIIQGRISEAQKVIGRLLPELERRRLDRQVVELLVVRALVFAAEGDTGSALLSLERALALAEPEGYVRVFVDEGWPLRRLLAVARSRGVSSAYASRLLDAFADVDVVTPFDTMHQGPLTRRELEILRLAAAGMTSTQMADHLVVSLHTVKTHMRSVHQKLEVHTRLQAVERARKLGLL